MAHAYTVNADPYGHVSEDDILEGLVNTVKARLNGNAEERFKMLSSVHLFLQEEYNWERHVGNPEGGDPKPAEEIKAEALQGTVLERQKPLTNTAILPKCVENKQTQRAVVTDEATEINAEYHELQREVAELRIQSSLVQQEKAYMKRKLQELSCMEQKNKLTQEKQVMMEQMKAEHAEVIALATEIAHRRSVLTQTCQELEERQQCIVRETESLQDKYSELEKQLESEEQLKKRKTQLEDEIGVLTIHQNTLTAQSKSLEEKLLQQAPLKLQCSELEAQILNTQNMIKHTEEKITMKIREVCQASELEVKIHELWEVRKVRICQKNELEEYLASLTSELEKLNVDLPKYEEQAAKHENLRKQNVALQENIDNVKREIRKAHARSDSYKQTLKAGAGLEDKNKELSKKVQKLNRELQTLRDVEGKHEKTKQDSDGLRTENLLLNEEIYSLEEQITSQKVLKASLKKLDMEMKSLSSSNDCKRRFIEWLQTQKKVQQPLRDRIKDYGKGIADLQLEKQRLQEEFEDLHVKSWAVIVKKALETALVGEGRALETGNIKRTSNICLESKNGIKLTSRQENNSELEKQLESEEPLKKRKTQLEDEIGVLTIHQNTLTAQSKSLEEKLLQQAPLKLQCSELEAQILNTQNMIKHTEEKITMKIKEVCQASDLEVKIQELWEVGKVRMCQKNELEEYLASLTRELERFNVDLPKYEEQAAKHENLRKQNVALQENIANVKREIRKAHARSDSYKQTLKAGAGLEDKNKELSKKVLKLDRELQTLRDVEGKHEKTKQDPLGVRTENLLLNEEIYSLEEQITSQKVLKASLKKLDMEMRSLRSSNDCKRKQIEWLQTQKQVQQPLRDRIKDYGKGIADLQLEKQRLQEEFEDLHVKSWTVIVKKALETALVGEGRALETGNIKRTSNICLENGIKLM